MIKVKLWDPNVHVSEPLTNNEAVTVELLRVLFNM